MENIKSEIQENLERELYSKYTKDLRNLDTNIKKHIMLNFIKKELKTMKESNEKDLWNNWFLIVENLDDLIYEQKEEIELIFLHSILKTNGFRKYCKQKLKEYGFYSV